MSDGMNWTAAACGLASVDSWASQPFAQHAPSFPFPRRLSVRYPCHATNAQHAETLAITGELDFFGPPANDDIVAGIPDARSVVIENAGHFVWVDQPDAFRGEVRQFLTH